MALLLLRMVVTNQLGRLLRFWVWRWDVVLLILLILLGLLILRLRSPHSPPEEESYSREGENTECRADRDTRAGTGGEAIVVFGFGARLGGAVSDGGSCGALCRGGRRLGGVGEGDIEVLRLDDLYGVV